MTIVAHLHAAAFSRGLPWPDLQCLGVLLNSVLNRLRAVADMTDMAVNPPHHLLAAMPHLLTHRVDTDWCPWFRVWSRAEQ
jgi:hypothetical protein